MSALEYALILVKKAVASQNRAVTFTQLNDNTGIPQGTAHRLAKELTRLGLLEFDPTAKTYRGGLMLASLGANVMAHFDLSRSMRPHLETLHNQLGHVVTLSIRDGDHGVYMDKIESDDFNLKLHSEVGKSFPLHCTAMGKVLLAFRSETDALKIKDLPLPAYTQNTIIRHKQLEETLGTIREAGYAVDEEEISLGLVCVAAPVFGVTGDLIGAISHTSPAHLQTRASRQQTIDTLCHYAEKASGLWTR